jgi:VWFA-related protein
MGQMISTVLLVLLSATALQPLASQVSAQRPSQEETTPSTQPLRITSPLGRTGLVTRLRIVAQISVPPAVTLSPVRFFVDGALIGTVENGPPYSVEWTDENPLERREILVQATDSSGRELRDTVSLPPFEVEERAEVKAVLLETGIYDKAGKSIGEMPASAFTVLEDGVQQVIDLVTRETVPTDVVLLVDNSQSMSSRMDFVKRATERLTAGLRKNDRTIVVPFNAHIGTITGPTNDRATIIQAIGAMHANGGTAVLDSLIEATHLLQNSEGRRALVLITDGFDENSIATSAEALKAVKEAQTTVYAVGIGGVAGIALRGETLLRELATATGGRVFFPPREQDVLSAAEAITTDAYNRFLVTYTPRNQKKDGLWRAVKVELPGEYRVRTRAGYFAPPPPPIRPTVEFTILDDHRRYVDAASDDLEVVEDGVVQRIETFQEAVDPVSIVLTLDASGSMKKSAELVKQTAREFVLAVRPEDSLALITFADQPKFAHTLATNRSWSLDAIEKYTPLGGTALYDALWNSLNTLKGVKGRRAVVVLSDGKDENNPGTAPGSTHQLKDVFALAKQAGAEIFAVGLGPTVDRPVLEQLAEESGGQTYYASDASDLRAQFRRVVDDLRRRYIISYTSTNATHDGEWRSLEIRPKNPSYSVLSTNGYFAPEN